MEAHRGTPPAEVTIDEDCVRRLLQAQHPDLAALPIRSFAHGWDNVMFRLGTAYLVRLPRRALGATLILNEQRFLPQLSPSLPITVPTPLRTGQPGQGYPWHWSILPWLDGEPATTAVMAPSEARRFADFLLALHQPAPSHAPSNPYRGLPLRQRAEGIEQRIHNLRADTNLVSDRVLALWDAGLAAPESAQRCWLHGDLHGGNVLLREGRIVAIIDWGDLCAGDPATDVAAFWMLFDDGVERGNALLHYLARRNESGLLARALGWAVAFATLLADSGRVDNPLHLSMGAAILRRLHRHSIDPSGPAAPSC